MKPACLETGLELRDLIFERRELCLGGPHNPARRWRATAVAMACSSAANLSGNGLDVQSGFRCLSGLLGSCFRFGLDRSVGSLHIRKPESRLHSSRFSILGGGKHPWLWSLRRGEPLASVGRLLIGFAGLQCFLGGELGVERGPSHQWAAWNSVGA